MPATEVHLGDVGTQFQVTFKDGSTVVDISEATTKQLIFKKPSGNVLTKSGTFLTDGSDGILTYTTVSGDVNEIGRWQLQGYLVIAGKIFSSDIVKFRVYRNLL